MVNKIDGSVRSCDNSRYIIQSRAPYVIPPTALLGDTINCPTVESSSCLLFTFTMSPPEVHHLFHNPIADHSFSTDKQTLAVARDSNVELYQKSGNKFSLTDELKGHEKTVTGVDIAPNSGRIVTCSQGKTASLRSSCARQLADTDFLRPQRIRLGAHSLRMEADLGPSPDQ